MFAGAINERESLSRITATLAGVSSTLSDLCFDIELRKAPVVFSTISPLKKGAVAKTSNAEEPISTPETYVGQRGPLLDEFKKPENSSRFPEDISTELKNDVNLRKFTFKFTEKLC